MKIGYVARWWPEFGGSYQYDLFALSALRRASPADELLVFYSDDRLPRDLGHIADGVRFFRVIDGTASLRLGPRMVRRALRLFYESLNLEPIILANTELKKHRLDVCVSTAPFVDGVFADCANILIVHDLWFRRYRAEGRKLSYSNWRNLRTQIGILNSDMCVVESPLGKRELQEFVRLDDGRIRVVPLPPAPFVEAYAEQDLPPPAKVSGPYVLYPAHYLAFKNHAVILKALHLLKQSGMRVAAVFCGPVTDPEYRDKLAEIARDLDLQAQVIFEGWVADRDLAALYQHAAALVMSSKFGPTNMPIWEAMAFGTPVVSCDVGDMPWQVGDAGLIFPADDAQALVSQLQLVLTKPELAAEYVRRGKQKVAALGQGAWGASLYNVAKEAFDLHRTAPQWQVGTPG